MSDPVTVAVRSRNGRRFAQALPTPEGRQALAASMTQPRRCGGLDYMKVPTSIPIYQHEKRMLAAIEPEATRALVYRLLGVTDEQAAVWLQALQQTQQVPK